MESVKSLKWSPARLVRHSGQSRCWAFGPQTVGDAELLSDLRITQCMKVVRHWTCFCISLHCLDVFFVCEILKRWLYDLLLSLVQVYVTVRVLFFIGTLMWTFCM